MSSLPFSKDLTEPAARLALAAPHQWAEFLAAFKKHVDTRRDQLVQAPADALSRVQGRAQECTTLASMFEQAVASAKSAALQKEKASR